MDSIKEPLILGSELSLLNSEDDRHTRRDERNDYED
jgi:hypothetical protein